MRITEHFTRKISQSYYLKAFKIKTQKFDTISEFKCIWYIYKSLLLKKKYKIWSRRVIFFIFSCYLTELIDFYNMPFGTRIKNIAESFQEIYLSPFPQTKNSSQLDFWKRVLIRLLTSTLQCRHCSWFQVNFSIWLSQVQNEDSIFSIGQWWELNKEWHI